MSTLMKVTACILLLVATQFVAGQAPKAKGQDQATEAQIPRLDGVGSLKSVFLIVCDSAPNKIIILDDTGRWIHRVKEAEIKIDGSSTSTVKCLMYEGAFRPSQPETKTWRLSQIKTVSDVDFQGMIDGLQTDPEAVKKKLTVPATPATTPTTEK